MASNPVPEFKTFMDGVTREVIDLILSNETGNIIIHFNGTNGLRREINRKGELAQLGAVELGQLRTTRQPQN